MRTPLDMFLKWEKETPDAIFLQQPFEGNWKVWTFREAGQEIRKIGAGLNALKLTPRSHVALLSKNCAHWIMADLAIILAGHISIPLYPTLTADSIRQILEHSGTKAIIAGKLDNYASQKAGIHKDIIKIGIERYGVAEDITWEGLLKTSAANNEFASWTEDEVITIIYTSGTTGEPKGVMHSMKAFNGFVDTSFSDLSVPMHPKVFSYLPLSHIAERAGIEMYGLSSGGIFSFSESLETFPRDLKSVQPDVFFAVPRIWSKFQEKILEKLPQKKLDLLLSIPIVNNIIRNGIRKNLGLSKAVLIVSGAAPISADVQKWFLKIGINVCQAIGMTEDCVFSHFNRNETNRFGTVGPRLTGVISKIAEDGELRIKTPGIMKGYYNNPAMTAEVFDEDGYFKTGDIGEYDHDGFLTITGRVKDQFKTDKGKYISPAPIEIKLLANTAIEQACVVGMGIPQPIALVILSPIGKSKSKDAIISDFTQLLSSLNADLQKHEKLEKIMVMREDWTIDNGLITPTLKVRRNEVEKLHVPSYSKWYTLPGVVAWE